MSNNGIFKKIDIFGKQINMTFEQTPIYKTTCGATATLIMMLTLGLMFLTECISISQGKLAKATYMIKNDYTNDKQDKKLEKKMKDEILGFAFEDHELNSLAFVKYRVEFAEEGRKSSKPANSTSTGKSGAGMKVYDCTEMVYANLNKRTSKMVPKNMKINCIRARSDILLDGKIPSIVFSECAGGRAKGCKSRKEINRKLNKFSIWSFVLADESDFTMPETQLDSNFTAVKLRVSNQFEKQSTMILREVEIEIEKGVVMQSLTGQKEAHMYLSSEEELLSVNKEDDILNLRMKIDQYSKVIITKTFKSYTDAIALIGGLSKLLGLFFFIFVWPVREVLFYSKMINEMFSVCVDEKQCRIALEMSNAQGKGGEASTEIKGEDSEEDGGGGIDYDLFVKAVDIDDGERDTGLMDDIVQASTITKEQYEENLKKFLEEGGGEGTNVFTAGLGKKKNKLHEGHEQPFTLMEVLEFPSVRLGMKSWLTKTRENMLQRQKDGLKNKLEAKKKDQEEAYKNFRKSKRTISDYQRNRKQRVTNLKNRQMNRMMQYLASLAKGNTPEMAKEKARLNKQGKKTIEKRNKGEKDQTQEMKNNNNLEEPKTQEGAGGSMAEVWNLGEEIDENVTMDHKQRSRIFEKVNSLYNDKNKNEVVTPSRKKLQDSPGQLTKRPKLSLNTINKMKRKVRKVREVLKDKAILKQINQEMDNLTQTKKEIKRERWVGMMEKKSDREVRMRKSRAQNEVEGGEKSAGIPNEEDPSSKGKALFAGLKNGKKKEKDGEEDDERSKKGKALFAGFRKNKEKAPDPKKEENDERSARGKALFAGFKKGKNKKEEPQKVGEESEDDRRARAKALFAGFKKKNQKKKEEASDDGESEDKPETPQEGEEGSQEEEKEPKKDEGRNFFAGLFKGLIAIEEDPEEPDDAGGGGGESKMSSTSSNPKNEALGSQGSSRSLRRRGEGNETDRRLIQKSGDNSPTKKGSKKRVLFKKGSKRMVEGGEGDSTPPQRIFNKKTFLREKSRFEKFKDQVSSIYNQSKQLFFYVKFLDFYKLWIPLNYRYASKTDLFHQVSFQVMAEASHNRPKR